MEYKNLFEMLDSEKRIENISENPKNSFIITNENGISKGYISNIGTNTIKKRKIV